MVLPRDLKNGVRREERRFNFFLIKKKKRQLQRYKNVAEQLEVWCGLNVDMI